MRSMRVVVVLELVPLADFERGGLLERRVGCENANCRGTLNEKSALLNILAIYIASSHPFG